MSIQLDINKKYSFADYLSWIDDKRRELINGIVKLMTPAPNIYHQDLSSRLFTDLAIFLRKNKKNCKLFHAPFDVRFPKNNKTADKEIFTVVQPDLLIVCDRKKLDKRGCIGAPNFIAEIISESTAKRDMEDKFYLYEEQGVKEYWIVFPEEKVIQSFFLKEGKYEKVGTFAKEDKIPVKIFDDFEIDLNEVFEDIFDEFDN